MSVRFLRSVWGYPLQLVMQKVLMAAVITVTAKLRIFLMISLFISVECGVLNVEFWGQDEQVPVQSGVLNVEC